MLADDAGKGCVPAAKQQTSLPIIARLALPLEKTPETMSFRQCSAAATKAAQISSWVTILRSITPMTSVPPACIDFGTVSTALNRLPSVVFGSIWLPSDASPAAPKLQLANG